MPGSDLPRMNPTPSRRGFVAALGLGQLVSWGALYYSFPLIAEAMAKDMSWSRNDIYGAATLGLLAAALIAYPVGAIIDQGQGRKVMVGATAATSITLVFWSAVTNMPALYAVVVTLGMLQAALLYEPAFAVAVRQLGTLQSRSAITTITLWAGFSSTLFVPLVQYMLDTLGWRGALLGLAAINAAIAAPLYLWAIPSGDIQEKGDHKVSVSAGNHILPIFRNPGFYLLTASFCAYMAMFSGFTYHIYPLLVALSADTQSVVFAIALIGPAQVGARIFILLFRQITIKHLGLLTGLAFPLAIWLLKAPPSTLSLAVLCVLYGGANGIFTIVRGMAVPELLSRRNYGRINGIMLVPMSLARAVAPWAIAAYWTHSGTPEGAIHVILTLAILVPVLFGLAIKANRIREEGPASGREDQDGFPAER
ncbi:MFS transporter [Marinobacter sp. 2_MG-2023]|uniref:MFS transporter n=1 Tax=Marinobacter sp. 2_MG-2023 TaxID=3062679 RepID=UPI0026E330B2|nr:MFS transporter [Marinobacter sp. 2_MG-2023]MDO6440537.1 MFS transporter [Marinobacter sp. 2_MG-2023]